MQRKWTRGEKWLWAAPLIFLVGAAVAAYGPQVVRRQLGYPQLLKLNAGDRASSLVLSRDGSTLAAPLTQPALRNTTGQIYFWDARTLKPLPPFGARPPLGREKTPNFTIALAPDGKTLALADSFWLAKPTLTLYNRDTQRPQWKVNGYFWNSVARFSPDGKTLVASRSEKNGTQILVLRASDGQVLTQWRSKISLDETRFSWAPDGKTLACLGSVPVPVTKGNYRGIAYQIEIRRASDGQLMRHWDSGPLQALDLSPDGRNLVAVTYQSAKSGVGSFDYRVAKFDAVTGFKQWDFENEKNGRRSFSSFNDAKFSPDGKQIAAISFVSGKVALLNSQTGAFERTLRLNQPVNPYSASPNALAWAPNSKRLYASGKDAVLVWDLD